MSNKDQYTNRLIHESSPYLLQHAHNPVNWHPWGDEALDLAKRENKLLIISIGYAACHWCHVMEHESFEDTEVAGFMNEHFVSIKVDREERPDIDQIYMTAVQLLSGSGGWPLNVIALPDGRPVHGGTYFRKEQWLSVLEQLLDFAEYNPERTEKQAQLLTEGVRRAEIIADSTTKDFTIHDLNAIFHQWDSTIDYEHGGTKQAPKFPLPNGYLFLLHYYYLSKNKKALKAVTTSLSKMAQGGIYDQLGGGFARYSTDIYWKVPHFEKMLYDNAQLVSLYSFAYQYTKDPLYKEIIAGTLEFINRELSSEEAGFYSSLDADSEGEEGRYYVWKSNELDNLLGDKSALIKQYYNVSQDGNFENKANILYKTQTDKDFAIAHNSKEKELVKQVQEATHTLLNARSKRVPPALDDKVLTSWNAMMLKGYVDAYRVFNEKKYLDVALKNAVFIIEKMKQKDGRLYRNYKKGKSTINGFLDDYAFTIDAFISLYQACFDEKWLHIGQELLEYTLLHFFDRQSGMFFYTSGLDPELIARKMEITDNVIPSSNSVMAKNLYMLGHYFNREDYLEKSGRMLSIVKEDTVRGGTYYSNWDTLMAWNVSEPFELAIIGEDCLKLRQEFDRHYLPDVFFSGGKDEGSLPLHRNKLVKGQTTVYVCRNRSCKQPVTDVVEAMRLIEG